jgi:hypothetical protein
MTMSCVDGETYQCSGDTAIRTENGVTLTRSGVQVYGRSTNDLADPIVVKTTASGFALATGGLAEVRVNKNSESTVSSPVLLLKDFGVSWDGKTERPPVIETFGTAQGRVQLDTNAAVTKGPLPSSSDLGFYDFPTKMAAATQGNYANNIYFPRTESSRCDAGVDPCPTLETTGLQNTAGDWRVAGGILPDWAGVIRLHNDGDVHAGDGVAGATGPGVPFPGSKGYRSFDSWNFAYANLSSWVSQDTVQMPEWSGGAGTDEHNTNRRGVVAFGEVTDPATVPASGTATYSGIFYGWYASDATVNPDVFRGKASVTVDFATRKVDVSFKSVTTYDTVNAPVPLLVFDTKAIMGAASTNVANYLTGAISNGTFTGGLGGRYFGPVVSTGTSGPGPAEIAGTLRLSNAATGAAVVGGFIGLKD